MSNRTPIYNFLYLEDGDVIYSGYDQDNMITGENEIFGMYSYFGPGIIDGWTIQWMGCVSDPYVIQQRQALIEAYRTDRFSYLSLQYQSLGFPATEEAWRQCVVVKPGLGIVEVFHAATENPTFFRFTTANHYYVWAQKNVCTNTEYLCDIVAPEYPDEDYDLTNRAVYIGEVFVNDVSGNIAVTQIIYSERRRELRSAKGEVQRLLKQALINHVHTGEGDMPSKINLSTNLTINIAITENSNTFIINFPAQFNASNYASPQVYLDSNLLLPNQYEISGNFLYLQNSVNPSSTIQIVYELAPGPNIFITSNLTPPLQARTLSFNTVYFLTDGTITTQSDETQIFNVWSWNDADYSQIEVYLGTEKLEPETYNLYQLNGVQNSGGRLQLVGPILPSINDYTELDITVKFVNPSLQVVNKLDSSRIESISANSFTRGTVPNSRITRLDHLGLFRFDDPARILPYKKLLDSGDHIHFYPEIESPVQHSDYVVYGAITKYFKEKASESNAISRTIISTPNGLYGTKDSSFDFANLFDTRWNTDTGVADIFAENYFGNFITYQLPNFNTTSLDPKIFWVLSKNKNQFKNILYFSTDFGKTFRKVSLPSNTSNNLVAINDFIATVNVFQFTTGQVILTPQLDVRYIYYIAASDGLYYAELERSQNKTKPIWQRPSKSTTNFPTGSLNKISEAVNVGVITTKNDTGLVEKSYTNYRNLYAACDLGLFVYQDRVGSKFITNSSSYNQDNSVFNYVKWLGDDDSSNSVYGVLWGDGYGCYYSNSGQVVTQTTTSATSSTTRTVYYEPLTIERNTSVSVQCASTTNIDLTATLTSVDGYELNDTDQVLVKNQNTPSENGIYIWSSAEQKLYLQPIGVAKILVLNGTQSGTEWIELNPDPNNESNRNFALWFANLFDLDSEDQVVSAVNDKSGGPGANINFGDFTLNTIYYHSFFVATKKKIYRVLGYNTPNILPTVVQINWDYVNNGLITGILHFNLNDSENGELVVLTENGIFRSTSDSFQFGPVDSLGDLILPNNSYIRFVNTISESEADNASVYDSFDYTEYTGKITSISFATSTTSLPDGAYRNQRVLSLDTQGTGLSVDFQVNSGQLSNLTINNPGSNYEDDLPNPFTFVNNEKIQLSNAVSQGFFVCNAFSQSFEYSKSAGLSPSKLFYEVNYTDFYIKPWVGEPLVSVKINNVLTDNTFGYNAEQGKIVFVESLPKSLKNSVTVSLANQGQYIFNEGETPHEEIFNYSLADSVPSASISSTFTSNSGTNLLSIKNVNNTFWDNSIKTIKVSGQRSATTNGPIQNYTEIIQVTVSTQGGVKIFVKSKPTTLPLTINSNIYVVRPYDNILGIEDKITQSRSNLTYHLDSVSHTNIYKLSNALLNVNPELYDFPVLGGETLTGVDRGLKNTIYLRDIDQFDPSATFNGFSFGVDPSADDVAAAPSSINLILDFAYGNNPIFTTDKGIWQYFRANKNWDRVDTVDNSNIIYFANKTLQDSSNKTNTYAGTDKGLYILSGGQYVLNPLFQEPTLSINMGSWYTNQKNTQQRFEAYGKEDSMSFVLRTTNTQTGSVKFQSDYFSGRKIYDIYYNTFYRYNDKGERTEHPAIYLATDFSVWAFTTSPAPGAPGPTSRGADHTLLVGRQIFGDNILRNPNPINPDAFGIPAKVFKIVEVPSGGRATWLAFATSTGVYVVTNWKACDVGDPEGLDFFVQNRFVVNPTTGLSCYTLIRKGSTDTYFVGTNIGVFISKDKCFSWKSTAKINGQDLSVSDLKYVTNNSSNYLIAATNIGLWVSDDDGESWQEISDYPDANIEIDSNPTYGVSLADFPTQTFSSISSGSINKAFIYLNPQNVTGITTLFATVSNGSATTQSESSLTLTSQSYPGMYGFAFTNADCVAGLVYSLGIATDNTVSASQVTWGLSNLQNPYSGGSAFIDGQEITNKDFYFKISLNTPPNPIEIIEPVGFYNTSYAIGFSRGNISGASISSSGHLYSNVGILCNVVLDTSKSFEINDTAIITSSGVSTSYLRQAVINSLVPSGVNTDCLYARLSNGMGTSKFIASVYGYNNLINDLLFFSSADANSSSSCLTSNSFVYEGYTNSASLIGNSVDYVANSGRTTKLYDAMLLNSRLQYPNVVSQFYKLNRNELDQNFVNVLAAKEEYKTDFDSFIELNLSLDTGNVYNARYQDNDNNFIWLPSKYNYSLVLLEDGTSTTNFTLDAALGQCTIISASTPTKLYLSKDWVFDSLISDLSSSFDACADSEYGFEILLNQYAKSYKPLIVLTTDGNDNSRATPLDVNKSLRVSWTGEGSQVLVIEPSSSGNENKLQEMILGTNSKIFKYSSYPEDEIKNILFEEDSLELFTSSWERKYEYDSDTFISYIFTSYVAPGNSVARVAFRWSSDRVVFSDFISLLSDQRYYLNQKVLAIEYLIEFKEDYENSARILPYVAQLYHVKVVPSVQTYVTYPQQTDGQLFEVLASSAFTNTDLVEVTPIVGRTESTDTTYFEQVQLGRNAALPNRQKSFRIRPAFTASSLKLLPLTNEPTNASYYIVDEFVNIYTWTPSDEFILFSDGQPVSPSGYNTIPESGILLINNLYSFVEGEYLYESFSAQINYVERRENIIGEPTTTFDNKTYYLRNGRIPTDAKVVVLVNQEIFKGTYTISPYDGTITFAVTLDPADYVTVFIQFANTYRAGLQVSNYNPQNLVLQSFNFTYTSLPNLPTYYESFTSAQPILVGAPSLSPSSPNLDDQMTVTYEYFDELNAPENNSEIIWWRKRTGIEYVTFDPSYNLNISGGPIGLATFDITSKFNPNDDPNQAYSLSVTIYSAAGVTTNVVGVTIKDRGTNFIGTSTSLPDSWTFPVTTNPLNLATITDIGAAITAYILTAPYTPGYATSDNYVRINPDSPIGYVNSINGISGAVTFTSFTNYDGKLSQDLSDIGTRTLFDYRDNVYVTVQPSNGTTEGTLYQSNISTLTKFYTPSASNLSILGSVSSNSAIGTSLVIFANTDQTPIYTFNYEEPQYTENSAFEWYKFTRSGAEIISRSGTLSSHLIQVSDQIYYAMLPRVIRADGTIGIGQTIVSDVFVVN